MDSNVILFSGLTFGVLFLLLAIGTPFWAAFLLSSLPVLFFTVPRPFFTIGDLAAGGVRSFTLLAIPLFILLGNICSVSGATRVLFDLARAFLGHVRAGVGMAGIVASAMFGSMCGSIIATAMAVGTVAVPELVKSKYSRETAAAICGTAGGLGALIPPSIGFVLLGEILRVSIGDLFLAGIVPGLILMVALCITAYFWCSRKKEIIVTRTFSWKERGKAILRALPMVVLPLSIIGSIWGGIATPTEAAGIGSVAALLMAKFYFRKFGRNEVKICLKNTAVTTAAIFSIILGAIVFGRVLALLFIPQSAANIVANLGLGVVAFKLAFLLLFIILGMFFDGLVLVLIALPPLVPILLSYPEIADNLIAFGVAFQLIVNMGQITPPVGVTLYAAAVGAKADIAGTIRESLVFLLAIFAVTLLVFFVPSLAIY